MNAALVVLACVGLGFLWNAVSFPMSYLAGFLGGAAYRLIHGREAALERRCQLGRVSPEALVAAVDRGVCRRIKAILPVLVKPVRLPGLYGAVALALQHAATRALWPLYAVVTLLASYELMAGRLALPGQEADIETDGDGYLLIEPWQVRQRAALALDLQFEVSGLDTDSTLALLVASEDGLHALGACLEAAVRRHIASLNAGACR